MFYGKSHGFYQFASLKFLSAATAVRAAWSTVNNWRFWYDFLHTVFQVGSDYSVTSNDNIWDADPFAFNLHRFSRGIVFGTSVDVLNFLVSRTFILIFLFSLLMTLMLKRFNSIFLSLLSVFSIIAILLIDYLSRLPSRRFF